MSSRIRENDLRKVMLRPRSTLKIKKTTLFGRHSETLNREINANQKSSNILRETSVEYKIVRVLVAIVQQHG